MDQHNNADDQLIHVNGIHIPSTSLMNSIIGIYFSWTQIKYGRERKGWFE